MRFSKPILAAALASVLSSAAFAQGVLVKIDGSSHRLPDHRGGGRGVPEGQEERDQGHGRHLRHRRRLQEVLPRRDRHLRRLAPDPQDGDGRLREAGIEYFELPVAFDALTVVVNPKNTFLDKGSPSSELKKMWEPAAQGKVTRWNQVNPAWPDAPIKLFGAGRRLRHVRLLHRGDRRQGQVQPRRLHRVARTTTCWCRACRATSTRSATSATPTTSRTRTS